MGSTVSGVCWFQDAAPPWQAQPETVPWQRAPAARGNGADACVASGSGDVGELLAVSDDRFVVMRHGDELTLEVQDPMPVAPGLERVYLLEADLYYRVQTDGRGRAPSL